VRFISIKWKIGFILVFSNLVLGFLLIIMINNIFSDKIGYELIERGRTIGKNIAWYGIGDIQERDQIKLHELVSGGLKFEGVEYIIIQADDSSVLSDSYNGQLPEGIAGRIYDPLSVQKSQPGIVKINEQGLSCYDIWIPVEDGYLGYVRVGMQKNYIDQIIRKNSVYLMAVIAGFTLLGIIVVVFLSNLIIRPIIYLTNRADEISQGKLEEIVSVKTNDEILKLAQALERLRESVKIALDRLSKQKSMRI